MQIMDMKRCHELYNNLSFLFGWLHNAECCWTMFSCSMNFISPMMCCNSKYLYYILQFNIICTYRLFFFFCSILKTVLLLHELHTNKNSKFFYPTPNISCSLYSIFGFRVFCFNWAIGVMIHQDFCNQSSFSLNVLVNYFYCFFLCAFQ